MSISLAPLVCGQLANNCSWYIPLPIYLNVDIKCRIFCTIVEVYLDNELTIGISIGNCPADLVALVAMMPEEELGLVILSNMDKSPIVFILMHQILRAYLGLPWVDISSEVLEVVRAMEEQSQPAVRKEEELRIKGTEPSLPLTEYAGTYESELYGELTITHENGQLVLNFGSALRGGLEHWHYDTFRLIPEDPYLIRSYIGRPQVAFILREGARVVEVNIGNPGIPGGFTLGTFDRV